MTCNNACGAASAAPRAVQRPSIGRIVLYVPTEPQLAAEASIRRTLRRDPREPEPDAPARLWPAIITRVWSDTSVNLTLLPDMGTPFGMARVDLLAEAAPVPEPRTAFWPPRA